ncbi:heat shock 70 kDa protein 12A isoform X2 [Magallana gigas]|uniref:heat shock 70 kDa protein 12A isoform X2 n=1 Tax=Magallana gigas TaxID=29159 RepID=UPI003341FE19
MTQEKQNPKKGGEQKREKIVVAAIDFGSTYSGYAFSFRDDFQTNPLKIHTNHWSSVQSGGISYKAPTTVLLKPDQTFHSFGYDAEDKYAELSEAEEHQEWYYFSRFKMKLMNALDISKDQAGSDCLFTKLERSMEIEDIDGKQMPYMAIIAHAIRYLKEHLLRQLNDKNILEAVTADGIFWVLTVPAIWTDSAKQFTREAAKEAGIHDDQLMLAYEPEAAALYCRLLPIDRFESGGEHQELVLKTFERGKKFMVIDLGGGTVDIAVQETTSDAEIKTIYKVCGGNWGGTKVDESFMKFLNELIGSENMRQIKNEGRSEYLEFLRGFELKKRTFNIDSKNRVVLKIPPAFMEIFSEKSGENFQNAIKTSKHMAALSLIGDKLNIDHSLITSFFESSVNDIISHIKDIFDADICLDLDGVVMVGGFAESMIVNSAVKKAFPDKKFIIPLEAGLAVAKGAVLYGHDPDIICSRICRYTYGENICEPFDEFLHDQSRQIIIERELLCYGCFRKFFTIGQEVSLGESVEMRSTFSFVDEDRQHMRNFPIDISVYISKKESPMYVDEEGCLLLGNIEIKCKNGQWPERVHVTVKMEITGTEVKVTPTMHTGEQVTATFDFL